MPEWWIKGIIYVVLLVIFGSLVWKKLEEMGLLRKWGKKGTHDNKKDTD